MSASELNLRRRYTKCYWY